jgi:pyruvate formate lyase activating enzyme
MADTPPTPPATLQRARRLALRNGLRYVYTGNIHDPQGASTYCHGCGRRVIERDRYQIGEWALDASGACLGCGTRIPGVFAAAPGSWGARRLPVRLSASPAAL